MVIGFQSGAQAIFHRNGEKAEEGKPRGAWLIVQMSSIRHEASFVENGRGRAVAHEEIAEHVCTQALATVTSAPCFKARLYGQN